MLGLDSAPKGLFLDELEAVMDEAQQLSTYLRDANVLPPGFPADDANLLCAALRGLRSGTVGVAVETLDYARKRIVIWRREHFPAKPRVDKKKNDPDAPPVPDRHSTLDNKLKTVFAGVSTAISTYEEVTGETVAQTIKPEQSITPETDQERTLKQLSKQATETAKEAGELETEARKSEDGFVQNTVARRLRDVKTQSQTVSVETAQDRPQASLLKKTGDGLRKAGEYVWDICCNADTDLKPLAEAWGKLQSSALMELLKGVRIVSKGIDDTLRSVSQRLLQKTQPPDDETLEQWELEAAVSILLGETIPEARRPHLRKIDLSGFSVSLFEALQACEADLTDIYVDPEADRFERQIKANDLSPLRALSGLQTLFFSRTDVSDLSPLSALSELRVLDLSGTQVSDLSPLSALSELQALYLDDTEVSDLSPLSALSGLRELDLNGTPVSDLSPLSALNGLEALILSNTPVSDLSPLSALSGLQGLYLNRTQANDLSPLSALSGLQTLYLKSTQVSNLSPLSALSELRELDLTRTQVSDLSPLSALSGLQLLFIEPTQVNDWSPVDHVDDVPGRPGDWPRKSKA